jgi:Tol biopolymer transport system component
MVRRLDWMPDGKNLIVTCPDRVEGNNALKVVSLDARTMIPLTTPSAVPGVSDEEPSVSPDGRTVAFLRGLQRSQTMLHLLSLTADLSAAGEPRVVPSTEGAEAPAWMAGSKEIVYGRHSVLWRVGVVGGSPRRVLELGTNVRQPAFDRDNRLVYATPVLDSNIWRQELTPEGTAARPAQPLIAFTTAEMSPDYSPDGTRIAFQSHKSGKGAIWTCANDGTRCNPVTEMQSGSPRWSPTSQKLAFDSMAAGNWDVLVMDATGGRPRRLTTDLANDSQPSWSKDGNFIYFSSARSGRDEIWKAPASGGREVQITHNGGYTAFESPDDDTLYYIKSDNDTKLWKCNPDGSGETPVLDAVSYRSFVVTKDRIYYMRPESGGSRTLRVLYRRTGQEAQIAVLPNTGRLGLSLSPDNRYLVYAQEDREGSDLMWVPNFR